MTFKVGSGSLQFELVEGWEQLPANLRHADLPVLELKFDANREDVAYRWKADEPAFHMPIRVGKRDHWQTITPTVEWQTLKTPLGRSKLQVATDLYYIAVSKS